MDFFSIQSTQIKIARASSAKDKTHLALKFDAIKQAKTMHVFGCCIALPFAAFSDSGFV